MHQTQVIKLRKAKRRFRSLRIDLQRALARGGKDVPAGVTNVNRMTSLRKIGLSYFDAAGKEVVVYCPESKNGEATLQPARRRLRQSGEDQVSDSDKPNSPSAVDSPPPKVDPADVPSPTLDKGAPELRDQHFSIHYGDTGYSYESILGPYLGGAKSVVIEDPYIRMPHQIQNFVRFCETVLRHSVAKKITLITGYDDKTQLADISEKLEEFKRAF